MKRITTLLLCLFILTGCITPPSKEELINADYGNYPANYKEVIKHYMIARLKDPMSAQYQYLGQLVKGWNGFFGDEFGYSICVYINARNGFGGYTGSKLHYFMIRDDRVVTHTKEFADVLCG